MFSSGESLHSLEEIKFRETDILAYYYNIKSLPCVINSPLRKDKKPSFGLFCDENYKVRFYDYATRDSGDLFDLIGKSYNFNLKKTVSKIVREQSHFKKNSCIITEYSTFSNTSTNSHFHTSIKLECKVREWKNYDIKYWESYGITLPWLKYAEIYPISHKIIIKNNHRYTFGAEKYAYAYAEYKEGNTTLKIYQPYSKKYKWSNNHDKSVISLWTKIPEKGNLVCICSSMKDALCLWSNTGIPCIAIQGEGYTMSQTALSNLKERYKNICVCLDNDTVGLKDAEKFCEKTGFINIVIPSFKDNEESKNDKDISDYFKKYGKRKFKAFFISLFKEKIVSE